jgi:ankyrin repeat protein
LLGKFEAKGYSQFFMENQIVCLDEDEVEQERSDNLSTPLLQACLFGSHSEVYGDISDQNRASGHFLIYELEEFEERHFKKYRRDPSIIFEPECVASSLIVQNKVLPSFDCLNCSQDGNTPLHLACIHWNIALMRNLLLKGSDLNIRNHVSTISRCQFTEFRLDSRHSKCFQKIYQREQ